MEIQPKQPSAKGPADWFTGVVWIDLVVRGREGFAPERRRRALQPGSPHRLALSRRWTDPLRHRRSWAGPVPAGADRGDTTPGTWIYTPDGRALARRRPRPLHDPPLDHRRGPGHWGDHVTDAEYGGRSRRMAMRARHFPDLIRTGGDDMTTWTPRTRIGDAEELQLASRRPDHTLRPYVTMWVVRSAMTSTCAPPTGRKTLGFAAPRPAAPADQASRTERDMTFSEADPNVQTTIDTAYHENLSLRSPALRPTPSPSNSYRLVTDHPSAGSHREQSTPAVTRVLRTSRRSRPTLRRRQER